MRGMGCGGEWAGTVKVRPEPAETPAYPAVRVCLLHLLLARTPPHQRPQQPHVVGAGGAQEGRRLGAAPGGRLRHAVRAPGAVLLSAWGRVEGVVRRDAAGVGQAREVLVLLVVSGVFPGLGIPRRGRRLRRHAERSAALRPGPGQQHHAVGRGGPGTGARGWATGTPGRGALRSPPLVPCGSSHAGRGASRAGGRERQAAAGTLSPELPRAPGVGGAGRRGGAEARGGAGRSGGAGGARRACPRPCPAGGCRQKLRTKAFWQRRDRVPAAWPGTESSWRRRSRAGTRGSRALSAPRRAAPEAAGERTPARSRVAARGARVARREHPQAEPAPPRAGGCVSGGGRGGGGVSGRRKQRARVACPGI